jgi:hypothetical protein
MAQINHITGRAGQIALETATPQVLTITEKRIFAAAYATAAKSH